MSSDTGGIKVVLVTDCGSTTTKALLFEKTAQGWRQTFRGEAPTTVEEPLADVTIGATNAFLELEELSQRKILSDTNGNKRFLERSADGRQGIDLYLSTSSAGGGLQMLVTGITKSISSESAQRAALGAGAIVLDIISADDGKEDHERIERIRHLRPDIILVTGGVDGGSRTHVIEVAEAILGASPKPRFGDSLKLPIIYAGNSEAANEVKEILEKIAQVSIVSNVRPKLEYENLPAAREAIHDFFLSHVMSHSPGFSKLMKWSSHAIMPTPMAVGDMVRRFAEAQVKQVLCADIGGATTDVFSVFRDGDDKMIFNRTVSANFGMSYSMANVMVEAGIDNIARWLPFKISASDLRDRLRNKMIRPTSIPYTKEDLWIEQAVCREALRLSLEHHRQLAVGLRGVQRKRGIADIFSQTENSEQLVDLMKLDVIIGSGGVLSHAPKRLQAALMMLDGFALEGLTEIMVDSIFMLPHLGVFSGINADAANQILMRDCLVRVAHSICPIYRRKVNTNDIIARIFLDDVETAPVKAKKISVIKVLQDKLINLKIVPVPFADVGAGLGETLEVEIIGAGQGIILDGRNRPLQWASSEEQRIKDQQEIFSSLEL